MPRTVLSAGAPRRPRELCGVELMRPKHAWARTRRSLSPRSGMQARQDADPQLDVLALQPADRVAVLFAETREVAILHADDVGVGEGEVDVEGDDGAAAARSGAPPACDDSPSTGAQSLADPHQDRAEQRLLVLEVAVDGGAADPDGRAEVLEAHAAVAALGEQPRRLVQDGGLPVGFGAIALGDTACHLS